ncbi:MAG: Nif11-like leader peptide family natural product precursor [Thermosynechococcaceae cyanobacterium MS004]|nr:Nif11-like leader peptide family natural product precursor [Thermosynechococcaceae cyanobacterium MS004]
MSTESVTQFFEAVYNDKELQGALNYALVKTSPDALIAIAQEKGFSFNKADLDAVGGDELSAEALDGVVGGAASSFSNLSQIALQTNFFSRYTNIGDLKASGDKFKLTIPGPSWVNQQSFQPVKAISENEESEAVSAVELFQSLVSES